MFIENVPEDVHRRFKGVCAMQGVSMRESILQHMTSATETGEKEKPAPSFDHIEDEEDRYTAMIDACWSGGEDVKAYVAYQGLVDQVEHAISHHDNATAKRITDSLVKYIQSYLPAGA